MNKKCIIHFITTNYIRWYVFQVPIHFNINLNCQIGHRSYSQNKCQLSVDLLRPAVDICMGNIKCPDSMQNTYFYFLSKYIICFMF